MAGVDESGSHARFDENLFPGRYLFALEVPDDWSAPSRPDPMEVQVLEIQIDDDDLYLRHLESLDSGDPYAVLERALACGAPGSSRTQPSDMKSLRRSLPRWWSVRKFLNRAVRISARRGSIR